MHQLRQAAVQDCRSQEPSIANAPCSTPAAAAPCPLPAMAARRSCPTRFAEAPARRGDPLHATCPMARRRRILPVCSVRAAARRLEQSRASPPMPRPRLVTPLPRPRLARAASTAPPHLHLARTRRRSPCAVSTPRRRATASLSRHCRAAMSAPRRRSPGVAPSRRCVHPGPQASQIRCGSGRNPRRVGDQEVAAGIA